MPLAAHLSKALFSPKPYLCGILRVAANSNTSLSSLLVSEGQRCGAELAIFPLPERLKDREWWQVWIDGVPLNCDHHHGQQGGQAHRYGGENSDWSLHGNPFFHLLWWETLKTGYRQSELFCVK